MSDTPKSTLMVTANITPTKFIMYHLLNLKRITVRKTDSIKETACNKADDVGSTMNPNMNVSKPM